MMAVGLKVELVRFWSSGLVEMSMFGWDFAVDSWLRFWRWNLSKLCVRTHHMTSRSYFSKMNSTLGSVVPLAMFITNHWIYAWNRFSIANKMMIKWVPGLLSWIVFFVLSSSHGKSVHTLECIRKGCKSWFRLIIDEVKALCALFWFWQHWLCQKLLMVTIMLKI